MGKKYYKGALHCHTYWSDGKAFPEEMVKLYREHNFDFVCQTDHNLYPDEPNFFLQVMPDDGPGWPPCINNAAFERYREQFGDTMEVKEIGGRTLVKLKTIAELKKQFDVPNEFLLLGGSEITCEYPVGLNGARLHVHVNHINLPGMVKPARGNDINSIIRDNFENIAQAAKLTKNEVFVMLNHPFWPYFDIMPSALIENWQYRHFEISNPGGSRLPIGEFYTPSKFFDIVNAFRIADGHPVLYAAAADDSHLYFAEPPWLDDSFVMVNAPKLTAPAILKALNQGDYYASTGVLFDTVDFDEKTKKLHVKVQAEPGVKYQLRFLATPRNFNHSVELKNWSEIPDRPPRISEVYSNDIGQCVAEFDGGEGACVLQDNWLYLRAEAYANQPSKLPVEASHSLHLTAWTQVFTNEKKH